MKCLLPYCLLLTVLAAACSTAVTPAPGPHTLTVFAAASLTDAFTEIGRSFEAAHPGIMVRFNFSGSQALRTQIEEGAPADVFASANTKEMDTLVAGGHVGKDVPKIFLSNRLVIIAAPGNPAGLANAEDLAKSGLKLVLAAEEVPVGQYARQALGQMDTAFGAGFMDKVLANVVSNEDNVRQVVAKVQLGEADAAIVYASDAVAAPGLKTVEIPADLNVVAIYPIAPLSSAPNADLAAQFSEYILSAQAQAVLRKWGFGPIP